jgi:hypothetical protein
MSDAKKTKGSAFQQILAATKTKGGVTRQQIADILFKTSTKGLTKDNAKKQAPIRVQHLRARGHKIVCENGTYKYNGFTDPTNKGRLPAVVPNLVLGAIANMG